MPKRGRPLGQLGEPLVADVARVAGVREARDIPLTFASLPAGSAVAHELAEGDVLELISSPLGAGMADPGGQLITTD